MQAAVDIVGQSPHPANKVASTIVGTDHHGQTYAFSRTNYWPHPIADHIGTETKIGNSSGTVHAETVCVIEAPLTRGAAIFSTDPSCPNCVKNMAEAGITTIYIDHKGMVKDFANRRKADFEQMSLRICRDAGIAIYEVTRDKAARTATLKPLIPEPASLAQKFTSAVIAPLQGLPDGQDFGLEITKAGQALQSDVFAVAVSSDPDVKYHLISAKAATVIGHPDDDDSHPPDSKYRYVLQPLNRLLMTASREGLTINPDFVFSSRIPTARELVNMIGAGLTKIRIGDMDSARDEHGPQALKQLQDANILTVTGPD